eukprot:gene21604-28604_t
MTVTEHDKALNPLVRARFPHGLAARSVVDDVVKALHQAAADSSFFSVARQCKTGSFGKRTAVHPNWGIDLVFFIRSKEEVGSPPFTELLSAFKDALLLRFDGVHILEITSMAVKIIFKGFKVDILVAPDLISGQLPGSRPAWAQQQALLKKLTPLELQMSSLQLSDETTAQMRLYSCAFAESAILFFKEQSEYIRPRVASASCGHKASLLASVLNA